jgi:holo-[acyl-carrier protein] synthase
MIVGIGIDTLDVARMKRELERAEGALKSEIFTPAEVAYCDGKRYPARHYAARFAAKEALLKALGAGRPDQPAWREVEVQNGPAGEPRLLLHGTLRQTAAELGVKRTLVSLSHTAGLAMACCLLES